MTEHIPLRRLSDAEGFRGAVLLFASGADRHITGQLLAVGDAASAVISPSAQP